jgi:hypothetical protein
MTSIPENTNALLTRAQTAIALTAAGYVITKATLETKATRGGGPPYQVWNGSKVTYRWGDALKWAKDRLSKPVSSTSELRGKTGAARLDSRVPTTA